VGRVKVVELTPEARQALEYCYRNNDSPAVRQRAQIILLKAKGLVAEDIAQIIGGTPATVHSWIGRYLTDGIAGLHTRPGRGRKSIFEPEQDREKLLSYVEEHRQSLAQAKAAYEAGGGKQASESTLRNFLKVLGTPIKGYEDR
jgi:transposase